MPNLTRHEPQKWQTPKVEDYPVHRHNGIDYRIVPESAIAKLMSEKDGLLWVSIGMMAVAIAAVTHVVINSLTPAATASSPMIVEKPIVVTQEKVVPTNCLAFCNR